MLIIEQATLSWQGDVPFSTEFNDVYFSSAGGLEETQSVFLAGNELPQRWQNVAHFTVAETGFGTGLNFLVTLQQWADSAPEDASLSFISIEKKPFARDDLKRALSVWPQLKAYSDELLAFYPECVAGFHRLSFLQERVNLTLVYADVAQALDELSGTQVDAWYLDGFAPSRNGDMWCAGVFERIASLSAPDATFSTYTAAGAVRRGLAAAGFAVEKKPGFGGKRERLQGRLLSPKTSEIKFPWFHSKTEKYAGKREAIVIGGGISGAAITHTLIKRGWTVTLLERHSQLAAEASGNLVGVVMPRLAVDMGLSSQFFMAAYLHTTSWLNRLKQEASNHLPWFQSGVLSLLPEDKAARLSAWQLPKSVVEKVDVQLASELSGAKLTKGGLYFPLAGYLDPVALINSLLNIQSSLTVECGVTVASIERVANQWLLCGSNGREYMSATLVLANGFDAMSLLGSPYLGLAKVRGQLSYLPAEALPQAINKPVCADGYVIPEYLQRYCVGATYDVDDMSAEIRAEDHARNIAALAKLFDADVATAQATDGRVAWRATTPDYLPVIGPALNYEFYMSHYQDLKHGRAPSRYSAAEYLPGLWLLAGMGSRGLVSAPYGAEVLADLIEGKPLCISESMRHALHPARMLVRRLKQGVVNL